MKAGREDRKKRLTSRNNGVWATSSADMVRLVRELYVHSARYAKEFDGNVSIYTLAGIPMMFSALRALLIEANAGIYGNGKDENKLKVLAGPKNEIDFVIEYYSLPDDLSENISIVYEIRNEIVHPAHMPAGTKTETPDYLKILRDLDLLQDGVWLSQLQSHKLFIWAMEVIESTAKIILLEHHSDENRLKSHLFVYSLYREYDL